MACSGGRVRCRMSPEHPALSRADLLCVVFMILVTLIISQLLVNIWMFYAKGAPAAG